ncbi:MAG: PQQ-binding-like beta-propeller repeat protein [Isosphaeraceae bacterium]
MLADPASTGKAFVGVTSDGRIRALAARDLSPIGAWPLDAPLALPPTEAGGRVFVSEVSGALTMLGEDGQRVWRIQLEGGSGLAGPPVVRDDAVWVISRDGHLHALALQDGSSRFRRSLRLLPAGAWRASRICRWSPCRWPHSALSCPNALQPGIPVRDRSEADAPREPPVILESSGTEANTMRRTDRATQLHRFTASRLSLLAFGFVLTLGLAPLTSLTQTVAPKPAANEPAVTNDLLLVAPFDRITLVDGTVILVDPLSPRPLPVIDPAKLREIERKRRAKKDPPPARGTSDSRATSRESRPKLRRPPTWSCPPRRW